MFENKPYELYLGDCLEVMDKLIEQGIKTIFYPCMPYSRKEYEKADNKYNCPIVISYAEVLKNNDAVCFIKYVDETPIGFAQCQLRYDYVEGTHSSPVGYLEGVFVEAEYQHKGYAKELVHECELWAKSKGCTEFASDCELDNTNSFNFHMAIGFEEANRVICFRKEL